MRPKKPRCQMHFSCGVQVRRQPRLNQRRKRRIQGLSTPADVASHLLCPSGGPGLMARATALCVVEYETHFRYFKFKFKVAKFCEQNS